MCTPQNKEGGASPKTAMVRYVLLSAIAIRLNRSGDQVVHRLTLMSLRKQEIATTLSCTIPSVLLSMTRLLIAETTSNQCFESSMTFFRKKNPLKYLTITLPKTWQIRLQHTLQLKFKPSGTILTLKIANLPRQSSTPSPISHSWDTFAIFNEDDLR